MGNFCVLKKHKARLAARLQEAVRVLRLLLRSVLEALLSMLSISLDALKVSQGIGRGALSRHVPVLRCTERRSRDSRRSLLLSKLEDQGPTPSLSPYYPSLLRSSSSAAFASPYVLKSPPPVHSCQTQPPHKPHRTPGAPCPKNIRRARLERISGVPHPENPYEYPQKILECPAPEYPQESLTGASSECRTPELARKFLTCRVGMKPVHHSAPYA